MHIVTDLASILLVFGALQENQVHFFFFFVTPIFFFLVFNLCVEVFFFVLSIFNLTLQKNEKVNLTLSSATRPVSILRGFQIYLCPKKLFRYALESGLFPLSQHPINTLKVNGITRNSRDDRFFRSARNTYYPNAP
jgi:hypothetical protein